MKQHPVFHLLRSVFSVCLFVGAGALLVGCSSNKGTLHGKVIYKSAPVTGGAISFCDDKGNTIAGGTITPEGTYSVLEVPKGKWKVTVNTESTKNKAPQPTKEQIAVAKAAAKKSGTEFKMPEGTQVASGKYVPIPRRYLQASTSDVMIEVKGGDQEADITLKE